MPLFLNGMELFLLLGAQLALLSGRANGGQDPPNYLFPDTFPFVDEDAPAVMRTLQTWGLQGNTLN